MKTTSITVERNFHILNEDRFIMEKISMTVELEEDDSPFTAISIARQSIENNFKLAYPYVHEYLNFNVVKQINGNDHNIKKVLHTFTVPPEPPNTSNKELIAMQDEEQKINKGTTPLAESIKADMRSYKLGASIFKTVFEYVKGNPELEEVYNEKLKELESKRKNKTL